MFILSLHSREARDGQPRSYVSLLCSPLLSSGEANCGHPLPPSREARGGHPLSYRFLSASYLLSSHLSRGILPSSREARGGHHLSCYFFSSLLTVLLERSYRLFFSSPLRLYNKREERANEKTREENRMRGCPPSPRPSLPLQKWMKRPQGANIR